MASAKSGQMDGHTDAWYFIVPLSGFFKTGGAQRAEFYLSITIIFVELANISIHVLNILQLTHAAGRMVSTMVLHL